jgi:hypothetical protein
VILGRRFPAGRLLRCIGEDKAGRQAVSSGSRPSFPGAWNLRAFDILDGFP